MASAKASELFPEFHSKSQEKHVIYSDKALTFQQASHIGYISFLRTSHIFHLKWIAMDQ